MTAWEPPRRPRPVYRANAPGVPGAPEELPPRLPGDLLRARVDARVAEARRIDAALRARIGRWHSTCTDCSD